MGPRSIVNCLLRVALISACSSDPGGGGRNPGTVSGGGGGAGASGGSGGSAGFDNPGTGGGTNIAGTGGPMQMDSGVLPGEEPRENMVIDECPGAVAMETAARLQDPALMPGTTPWLYPYDQTVFPRGLIAPVLQWEAPSGGADAVLIHMRSSFLDYKICLPLTEPMRVQIPQAAWDIAGAQSVGRGDPMTLDVVLSSGGSALRLATRTLSFALADLKGAIYYNTYNSLLAAQVGAIGGVVMRILPHEPEPDVFATVTNLGECIGCHAVSADGSRMVAETHAGGGAAEGPSRSFDLTTVGTGINPAPLRSDLRRAGFSGIYPDGSVYVTTGRVDPGPLGGPSFGGGATVVTGTFGPEESKLFDTNSGAELTGSGVHPYAYMPSFSSDGSELAFNKMETGGASGHTLAVMNFDRASNTFSELRDVFSDSMRFPAWPFFLPDVVGMLEENNQTRGKRVLFSLGTNPDFVTAGLTFGTIAQSDLWWVDVDSGMAAPLDRANGIDGGQLYLPHGAADSSKSFVPTVSPVAAGGYFWVFFTSRRSYGNLMVVDQALNSPEAKKIWVAALDIDAPPGSDPSHPAFYLPNQELESGNIRAFAALEPCRENESACTSGIDCCCGFCIEGQCGCKPPDRCANLDERCETAADCCSPSAACIGGFCQLLGPE
jgi:hypothetical protein